MNNNSSHCPRSIGDAEGLLGRPEGGRLMLSEPNTCSCRHKRWMSSCAMVEIGWQGKWRMVRVWGVCTHHRLDWCKRGSAPKSQLSLCQRQPGIPVGVFQWWCYRCRATTGWRRKWVSAELSTLYSHTDASLWVSHISWNHFLTTVQLTDFGHTGVCIWYIFTCATLYAGYWLYDQALKWYLLHGKPRGVTTGPPWPWNTQGSPGSFIWQALLSLQTQPQHPLLQEVLLDQPQPLPLNSDHIQSTPHKWSFHLTCIYSLPISQAGMGIPEDK